MELSDMLESKDEKIPNTGVNVTLHPPLNSTDDVTDEYSSAEENPSVDKLPASQLYATVLHDLKERGVEATGTISGNSVKNCTLSFVDKMIKENRGSNEICSYSASRISIARWNDNNVVTVATNFDRVQPLSSVTRFSREQKKRISVLKPNLLHSCNTHMGGIDRTDQNESPYRCSIRGKNDHLTFRRRIVTAILESNKRVTTSRGRSSKRAKLNSRFGGREHYVTELPTDEITKMKKQLKCRKLATKKLLLSVLANNSNLFMFI
ncbi:piggyBac transposable element-derived protein 3-like [Schistocerca serialis cubense]|uniref:piggyBac transposable element-derived protein 3-like n=1 Tax=Schistocerca serialis cubense TaxID=2023355 RepID=UPI00214DF874|nr:piggyBac transposable element-derived protein 3-like [Schistocerca serialis cubense]